MKGYINAIKWEIILDFKEYLRYRIGLLMDLVVFTGTFIIIYFMGVSEGFVTFYNTSEESGNILVLIGYIFWQNASAALGYCTGTISSETAHGIFEIRLQSKYHIEGILFFRLLVSCLIHLVTYVGIILFAGIVVGYNLKDISILTLAILISLPTLIGMYGMGLIFGSICVCEKSVGSLVLVIQTLLLFITNTLSPSRNDFVYLIPFTSGIDIVRKVYLGVNISVSLVGTYFIVNIVWMVIGICCFRFALKYEKKYGSFDNY